MITSIKSPAQSLNYRVNSYHIHMNNLEFHGYGKEISQKYPYSSQPINTSFLSTHFLPYHSLSPSSFSPAATLTKSSRTPAISNSHTARLVTQDFQTPDLPPTGRNGRQLHCS